jgi:hypothetical protein
VERREKRGKMEIRRWQDDIRREYGEKHKARRCHDEKRTKKYIKIAYR